MNFETLNMGKGGGGVALHFSLQLANHKTQWSGLYLVLCASQITVPSDFIIAD